jgi:hypothetical protein
MGYLELFADLELVTVRWTRRACVKRIAALGLAVPGSATGWPRTALAVPAVTVAPPTIERQANCTAHVSVRVTIAGLPPGVRYEVSGDIMESDERDGNRDDVGCALDPQSTPVGPTEKYVLLLTATAMAADLGLVKGYGPASDEAFSPDLVELYARIWLRDLATGDRYGPSESPLRVAVASGALAWTQATQLPGSALLTPRRATPVSGGSGVPLPSQECAP